MAFPLDRVVVIGDTPHDVTGAHDAQVRVVAVATRARGGHYPAGHGAGAGRQGGL